MTAEAERRLTAQETLSAQVFAGAARRGPAPTAAGPEGSVFGDRLIGMGRAADAPPVDVVTVRFFAGARAAAGMSETRVPAGLTHEAFVATLTERHGDRLATVLKAASFLVDGVVWRDGQRPLPAGAEVDVLPPFAGG